MSERVDAWLIRTSTNQISGPFPKAEIISRIQKGELGPEDEVCLANHYWIYLDERDEVLRQLGIELPRKPGRQQDDEEITETETETLTQDTDAFPQAMDHGGGSVQQQTTLYQRRSAGDSSPIAIRNQPKPLVLGRVEKPGIWRMVTTLLIILTSALVIVLIRLLKTS